jgi:polyisoprenoid-binding protein YceI
MIKKPAYNRPRRRSTELPISIPSPMPSFPLRRGTRIAACMAGVLAIGAHAAQEHFVIDPVHTRIAFRVEHLGLSHSIGTFSGANGTLDFDADDWRGAKLDVSIPLDKLDMGNDGWKKKVLSDAFLDFAKQPVARFVATSVAPIDKTHAKVTGTLSLRGHDSTVVLDVTLNGLKRSLYTEFHKTAGFSATATLHRKELGMDAYPDAVGEDVAIDIEAEARAHADGNAPKATQETQ